MDKARLSEILNSTFIKDLLDLPGILFYNLYLEFPHVYRIYIDDNTEDLIICETSTSTEHIKIDKHKKKCIDARYFVKNVVKKFDVLYMSNTEYFIFGEDEHPFVIYEISNSHNEIDANSYIEIVCAEKDIKYIVNQLRPYITPHDKEEIFDFGIATFNGNTMYTAHYDYDPKYVDIDMNYNDDFKPAYEKICNIIEKKNETGLILLYGEPGTGKSSIIKNLISEYPDKDFVFVDGSLLSSVSQNTLVSYFIDNQETIFILEDCEKVLMSREENYNPVINTLLNITDGIIGDVLGIKLICTFNTSLSKIDKALLRKGRLSLKYEFTKLKADKVSKILGREVKEDMTLADIYNMDDENDFSKKENKKIGFNQK